MNAPTLIRVGYMWQVTYASGEIKTHSQYWQALIYYHQAQRDADSLLILQLSQDSILDAASTSPTILDDL